MNRIIITFRINSINFIKKVDSIIYFHLRPSLPEWEVYGSIYQSKSHSVKLNWNACHENEKPKYIIDFKWIISIESINFHTCSCCIVICCNSTSVEHHTNYSEINFSNSCKNFEERICCVILNINQKVWCL